jgi:hypothetical protein
MNKSNAAEEVQRNVKLKEDYKERRSHLTKQKISETTKNQ